MKWNKIEPMIPECHNCELDAVWQSDEDILLCNECYKKKTVRKIRIKERCEG